MCPDCPWKPRGLVKECFYPLNLHLLLPSGQKLRGRWPRLSTTVSKQQRGILCWASATTGPLQCPLNLPAPQPPTLSCSMLKVVGGPCIPLRYAPHPTPPPPECTPHSVSSGAEKLGAEKDGWEGKGGTDPAKMGQHGGPGACQQGALLLINEI